MTFAKKSLGQHFLHDKNICNKIVELLDIKQEDAILEIGPGTGALTNILKQKPFSSFLILEKDDRFAQLHAEESIENVQVIHTDALKFDWTSLNNRIKIISNLPYNVASPLMWDIVSQTPLLERAVFMIQNEVADRCVAQVNTKHYGVLSIWLQAFCKIEKNFVVSPRAFNPPPKVDSAVITLIPLARELYPKNPLVFADLIKLLFQQRRKQLGGVLKKSRFAACAAAMLDAHGIDSAQRAETIGVETFISMSDFISSL